MKRLESWPRNMDINKRQAELLIGMVDNTPINTTAVNAEAVIADLQLILDLKAKLIAILDPKES